MAKRSTSIPVNTMAGDISTEKMFIKDLQTLDKANLNGFEEATLAHRHDRHSFFLLESGLISIEIDFQQYKIQSPSVIYMYPNQVHRTITFLNLIVGQLGNQQ